MTPAKRALDVALALLLGLLLALPAAAIAALILLLDGRPVLYVAERMQTPARGFPLLKFRTMRRGPGAGERGVSGGDKRARVTPLGRLLRRTRLDEIPQLWNILRGDMSFVGPRPPLREYVLRFPDLYGRVLQSRPGVTGLATLVFHAREERLLAPCRTPAETDAVYVRRAVPRKARLDLIYQRARGRPGGLCLDLRLIAVTAAGLLPAPLRPKSRLSSPRRHG
ncbi:MAG: sugar transferase [Rhodobacteraceae bacterium]|nr:sugar transferase [Paracoccaceae bacterium]